MPWARPASAGLSCSVSETNGSTAANAYQSAARKISHRMASTSIHFCQVEMRCRSVSETVVQVVMMVLVGLELNDRVWQSGSGRRWQEIDFMLGRNAHDFLRVGQVVDAFEQLLQRPRRRHPEQAGR